MSPTTINPALDATPRFALVRGADTTFSESTTDLVEVVLPGYTALDDDAAMLARWECAAATATELQQLLAAANDLDPATESEDTLTAIFTDRANPLPDGSLDGAGEWTHPVPLVLLATDYAPFTEVPAPHGNVQFLDSSTEGAFLRTLSALGVHQFYAHEPARSPS